MRYYCNICRKDITKAEFLYSIDKFDRALCREHQQIERDSKRISYQPPQLVPEIVQESVVVEEPPVEDSKRGWKSVLKSVAVTTGKGIVKGTKKLIDSSRRSMQVRQWKEQILRRMNKAELDRLCREKRISTSAKRSSLKQGSKGDLYWKESTHTYTYDELVGRIRNRVRLDDLISFAKRSHINIRDILGEIDQKKAEWRVKELDEEMHEGGIEFLKELEKAIYEFKPLRRFYEKEILYQDTLASWLRSQFADYEVEVEVASGSTRPDIVVNGVAIEIKGPTFDTDLETISDKCMRYMQYFPNGMICVLFSVHVSQQRYTDWLRGMKDKYPEVVVIRK